MVKMRLFGPKLPGEVHFRLFRRFSTFSTVFDFFDIFRLFRHFSTFSIFPDFFDFFRVFRFFPSFSIFSEFFDFFPTVSIFSTFSTFFDFFDFFRLFRLFCPTWVPTNFCAESHFDLHKSTHLRVNLSWISVHWTPFHPHIPTHTHTNRSHTFLGRSEVPQCESGFWGSKNARFFIFFLR